MADLQTFLHRNEVGQIKPWGKSTAPTGYVLCNGAAISRTDYADLYGVIGTTYGTGDGSSTFNVPNLAGKMPQGYDGNTYNMAGSGGANTVTVSVTNNQAVSTITSTATSTQSVTVTGNIANTSLTEAQIASHNHNAASGNRNDGTPPNNGGPTLPGQGYPPANETGNAFGPALRNAGSGTAHNHSHNLTGTLTGNVSVTNSGGSLTGTVTAAGTNSFSPFVVVNYIIKY